MKFLENKDVEFSATKERKNYGFLLSACIENPPQGGFLIDDIEKRLRIKKAINEGKEEIKLEDADYAIAKNCLLAMKWRIMDKVLVEFTNDFLAAEKMKA